MNTELTGEYLAEQRKPFAGVAALYGLVGSLVVLGFTPDPYSALPWFLSFFGLATANLFFLSKVVAVLLDLMSHQGTEKGLYNTSHLFIHGTMKLVLLGAIFLLAWKSDSAPLLAKAMGLGALVAIPLFGGLWMSRQTYPERV